MKYILYRTTCNVNNKFYIGKRKLIGQNDSYLGSGLLLRRAIKKYGKENFTRETLEEFNTQEELDNAERKAITPEMLEDDNCYNAALGGQGGFLGETVRHKQRNSWTEERRNSQKKKFAEIKKTESYIRAIADKGNGWGSMTDTQKESQAIVMKNAITELWKDPEHRRKMAIVRSKTPVSEAFRLATKGRVWMHNPLTKSRKLVIKNDVNDLLLLEWKMGKKIT